MPFSKQLYWGGLCQYNTHTLMCALCWYRHQRVFMLLSRVEEEILATMPSQVTSCMCVQNRWARSRVWRWSRRAWKGLDTKVCLGTIRTAADWIGPTGLCLVDFKFIFLSSFKHASCSPTCFLPLYISCTRLKFDFAKERHVIGRLCTRYVCLEVQM